VGGTIESVAGGWPNSWERTTIVVTKQKNELVESTSSLKETLEAMKALKKKIHQDNVATEKAQQALKDELATIEAEKTKLAKGKSKPKKGRMHS